jgi:hypothetical protein
LRSIALVHYGEAIYLPIDRTFPKRVQAPSLEVIIPRRDNYFRALAPAALQLQMSALGQLLPLRARNDHSKRVGLAKSYPLIAQRRRHMAAIFRKLGPDRLLQSHILLCRPIEAIIYFRGTLTSY